MDTTVKDLFLNRQAVIATMHKKEQVIAPILEKELGICVTVPKNFNTDLFGTFTNEVERAGDQLQAARKKVEKAMKQSNVGIGISSEGSFGPHPFIPYLPYNRELVLLVDQEQELEIVGHIANSNTNYAQKVIKTVEEAYEFALSIGFPTHGVIVKTNSSTTKMDEMVKGITDVNHLHHVLHNLFSKSADSLYIETDMRALYNPTRMKNIELATIDLVSKIRSLCPNCSSPGFEVTESKKGLECEYCGCPTELVRSHIFECKKCNHQEEELYPKGKEYADPSQCPLCNP
ncbi:hypothetical protein BKP45_13965 [Anaerobacillus alkalidiazotrophicus]|uniref:DUF6671 domain-containing protein n=1 Tax=Anaerobacillus alkalidiazotrophicus TaxID=472963 RepID=A0A1S2M3D3_9BACI|nr:DUF6671 family protein [Anaerobacillus alkalidiazotrophicus]OIJ19259.1 hypothetical protein BKP45_13965 [Anaerobacillus alkalidiazotrophicus]